MARKYVGTAPLYGRIYASFLFHDVEPKVWTGVFEGAPSGVGADLSASLSYVGVVGSLPTLQGASNAAPTYTAPNAWRVDQSDRGLGVCPVFFALSPDNLPDLSALRRGPDGWTPVGLGASVVTAKEAYDKGITNTSVKVGLKVKPNITSVPLTTVPVPPSVNIDVTLRSEMAKADTAVPSKTRLAERFSAAARTAFERLGHVHFQPSEKQPETWEVDAKKHPSLKDYRVVHNFPVMSKPRGAIEVDFTVPVYLYVDGSQIVWSAVGPTAEDGEEALALLAKTAYESELSKAIILKNAGAPYVVPSAERPEKTKAAGLNEESLRFYDDWWNNMTAVRAALIAKSPVEGSGYSNYTQSGGTLSEDDWRAQVVSKTNDGGPTGESFQSGFWSGIGNALGWMGDKVVDGVGWLGSATVDLLKDWGPAGTVGAYAGVKATNAIDGADTKKMLLYGGLAVGALLILTR